MTLDRANAGLYAEAGVREYWIVNGERKEIEVYRKPVNGTYTEVSVHHVGDTISCAVVPVLRFSIADLFD